MGEGNANAQRLVHLTYDFRRLVCIRMWSSTQMKFAARAGHQLQTYGKLISNELKSNEIETMFVENENGNGLVQ